MFSTILPGVKMAQEMLSSTTRFVGTDGTSVLLCTQEVLWRMTFPVTFLTKEELWRTFLVDLMKPSCKVGEFLSIKVSTSVSLELH